jgi:Flp pilus assembly protein protease CpaA
MIGYVISMIILCVLGYQDFKKRQVSLLLLAALFLLFFIIAYQTEGSLKVVFKNFLINAGFILAQILFVKIYFSIKNKRNETLLDRYIGKGDVFFFIISCLAFSVTWFIPFYIGSLIIALIITIIFNGITKARKVQIPLAGIMSIIMVLSITIKLAHNSFSFYDDSYLFQLLKLPVQ